MSHSRKVESILGITPEGLDWKGFEGVFRGILRRFSSSLGACKVGQMKKE